jgi:hypothetical protein
LLRLENAPLFGFPYLLIHIRPAAADRAFADPITQLNARFDDLIAWRHDCALPDGIQYTASSTSLRDQSKGSKRSSRSLLCFAVSVKLANMIVRRWLSPQNRNFRFSAK